MDLRILLKNKRLYREIYLTILIKLTVQVNFLMEIGVSREPFVFSMAVLGSTIRPTTINTFSVIYYQHIMTPLFITLDMFALVVPYLFDVLFLTIMTD